MESDQAKELLNVLLHIQRRFLNFWHGSAFLQVMHKIFKCESECFLCEVKELNVAARFGIQLLMATDSDHEQYQSFAIADLR